MRRYLVAGTNTGVGKTYFAGLYARRLCEEGLSVRYVKPVQTGYPPDDDAAVVRELSGLPIERTRTLFTAPEPVAACFAFEEFPYDEAVSRVNATTDCDVLLVECAGGLLSPLSARRFCWHFARDCALTTILVVPNRLGCINDALLSAHFLESQGLDYLVALNDHFPNDPVNRERNRGMLEKLLPGRLRESFDAGGPRSAP